jgi:aspartyl protease family protein
MNRNVAIILGWVAVAAVLLWLAGRSNDGDEYIFAAVSGAIAVLLLVVGWRGTLTEAVRNVLIWLGIGFLLILGYSYRGDFKDAWQRVAGEINPSMPQERAGGQIVLRREGDGHFYADVTVNGIRITMLADTAASSISLSLEDAKRVGIDVTKLAFDIPTSTAAGMVLSAETTLEEVRVGSIVRRKIRAMVARDMSGSLLGMNFFNTLSKFSIERNELLLTH